MQVFMSVGKASLSTIRLYFVFCCHPYMVSTHDLLASWPYFINQVPRCLVVFFQPILAKGIATKYMVLLSWSQAQIGRLMLTSSILATLHNKTS